MGHTAMKMVGCAMKSRLLIEQRRRRWKRSWQRSMFPSPQRASRSNQRGTTPRRIVALRAVPHDEQPDERHWKRDAMNVKTIDADGRAAAGVTHETSRADHG